jgi:RHS repeat-associated protein
MAARTSVGPQISLRFDYDWKSRRIRKQVWANTTWTGSATNDQRFAYDGWNLAGILTSSFTLQASFAWGLDLGGSLQGAGGVGGLLFIGNWLSAIGYYAAAYDGNGNVAALVSAADGTVSANYEYGPFGEVTRATGPMAKANHFRFSTKYQDEETDLLYYGYRYYSPNTGRWLSRDPIEERGGLNPYGFVGNSPMILHDAVGLAFYYNWSIQFLEHQPRIWEPGYNMYAGAYTSAKRDPEPPDHWVRCRCGWRMDDFKETTTISVHFTTTLNDAATQSYPSGRSMLDHEMVHANAELLYDAIRVPAYAFAYDRCLTPKCYHYTAIWLSQVTQLAHISRDVVNYATDCADYGNPYACTMVQQSLAALAAQAGNVFTASVNMAIGCSGL